MRASDLAKRIRSGTRSPPEKSRPRQMSSNALRCRESLTDRSRLAAAEYGFDDEYLFPSTVRLVAWIGSALYEARTRASRAPAPAGLLLQVASALVTRVARFNRDGAEATASLQYVQWPPGDIFGNWDGCTASAGRPLRERLDRLVLEADPELHQGERE